MNKTLLTILSIFFSWVTAFTQDLNQTVNLDFDNVPLQEVLDHVSKTYSVDFFYGNSQIPLTQKVSLVVIEKPLNVALKELFKELSVQYKVIEKYVVLKKDDLTYLPRQITQDAIVSIREKIEAEQVAELIIESYRKPIQMDTLTQVSKKSLDSSIGFDSNGQHKIQKINSIISESDHSSENLIIGKKASFSFGPTSSYNRYQFNFKDPENGDQSFTTDFNYSLGLSILLEAKSRFAVQLMPQYATRNFSYQYNFRIFDVNDPTPIPKETQVDLDYVDIPLLFHYPVFQKKDFKLSVTTGGLASFLIRESEQTDFENSENVEATEIFSDGINKSLFGATLGVRATYNTSPSTEVSLMPHYTYFFNAINDAITDGNISQWTINISFHFTLKSL